jgi:hypothetical protein
MIRQRHRNRKKEKHNLCTRYWRLWCKALGTKEGVSNSEADVIAIIRTLILLGYMVTNCFIVAGVIRHWDANVPVSVDTKVIKK